MPRYHHFPPVDVPFRTAGERDEMIVKLRKNGMSLRRIARMTGMRSAGAVQSALERIAEGRPGRDPRA